MDFDIPAMGAMDRYKLLVGLVVPRPIAFVTTRSLTGVMNAAPFSFFNLFGSDPPVVAIGINVRPSGYKDTYKNIIDTGEFVLNTVNADLAERMNACSMEAPPEIDELAEAGLTERPSTVVSPPGIMEAPANLECRLLQTIALGPAFNLILGQIVHARVDDALLDGGKVDQKALQAIGRMGGPLYSTTTDLFPMQRPAD